MKKIFVLLLFVMCVAVTAGAQDYDIRMAGQGDGGRYYVKITTVLDKKQNKTAYDYLRRLATEGVLFRGVAGANGYPSQKAILTDVTIKSRKAEFFDAFYREKQYDNFVMLETESVVVTKLPKKKFEVTGRLLVDKEGLLHLMEDSGVIQGMGNLW